MIHRGILLKSLVEEFRLSEHTEVTGAIEDGLLVIDLKVVVPEEERPRTIKIK